MSKLDAKKVLNARVKRQEYKLADGNGLFLRVRTNGIKSWLFCFRLPGDRTVIRMTLGSTENISLKEARVKVTELRKLVVEGIDPRSARAAARAENAHAITMQKLFQDWIEFIKITGEVTLIWIKRHEDRWRLHLKKNLENLFVKDVTRGHLASALDAMARKGIREETRKALTTLNLMLDYGLTRHYIDQNPSRMLKPKDFSASPNRSRDRVLTLEELQKLWKVLDRTILIKKGKETKLAMNPVLSGAIKLLILTGARRGEVAGMQWEELSVDREEWVLPSTRTKNKNKHVIFLHPLSLKILSELRLLTGGSKFVFNTGSGSIHRDYITNAINKLLAVSPNAKEKKKATSAPLSDVKPFTVHDIRRSCSTAWAEHLKVQPHIIERMLNHQPLNKLVAVYQRATYSEEQKAAWRAWGDLVEKQIAINKNNILLFRKESHDDESEFSKKVLRKKSSVETIL